jgi:triphosphoribosyl-dephospho-CoA synthase
MVSAGVESSLVATASAALADHAVRALIDEAVLTPKPGAVDAKDNGSHKDMNLAMLVASAHSLAQAFTELAEIGAAIPIGPDLRRAVGAVGRAGELSMLEATGGINTHRGALWAIGLLVTAAAATPGGSAEPIASAAGGIARITDDALPPQPLSHGQRSRRSYGVRGAVGQAQQGFPDVVQVALPTLRARRPSCGPRCAQLDALLAVMAGLDDTCVLHRAGLDGLRRTQAGAARVLALGGSSTRRGHRALLRLGRELTSRHISPGGSTDLLACAIFLDHVAAQSNWDNATRTTDEEMVCRL